MGKYLTAIAAAGLITFGSIATYSQGKSIDTLVNNIQTQTSVQEDTSGAKNEIWGDFDGNEKPERAKIVKKRLEVEGLGGPNIYGVYAISVINGGKGKKDYIRCEYLEGTEKKIVKIEYDKGFWVTTPIQ